MTCIARTIFTSFSASVHQDVGIRMRRLRGLEYASAATQAQGTAPGSPCWRSSCLLSALTPPFHATRLAALVSLAIWRQFRSCCTERSIFLVLPICHFLFARGNRSILRSSLSSNHLTCHPLRVSCQLTVPSYSDSTEIL